MRARLLVIAVFVSASAVPGILAFSTGVIPAEMSFAGGSKSASREFRVTSLGWPKKALGLTSTTDLVAWQQRSSDPTSGGLWVYDVRIQRPYQLVDAQQMGRDAGRPSMSGGVVAWTARAPGPGKRPLGVRAFDSDSGRLFPVASRGSLPSASGDDIVWVARRGASTRERFSLQGLNTVTDEHYALQTRGRVCDVAVFGRWVAWSCRQGASAGVWAANRRNGSRYQLARSSALVAIDGQRVVWAARAGDETTIVAWNVHSNISKEIYRVRGSVSALALAGNIVVWVQDTGDGDIWAYDLDRRRAYPVCADEGEQASPVLVGRTVFWADHRSGQWELYGRALQP